jgi:hypothetical protein
MFLLGFIFGKVIEEIKKKLKNKSIIKKCIKQFNELYDKLEKSELIFNSRVNNTVMLDTHLLDYEFVNIIYLMDKEIVCIFKDNQCIYTSDILDIEFNKKLLDKIHENYGNEINDVVDILGVTISKEELNNKLKDFENFNPNLDLTMLNKKEISEVEKIVEENEEKFELDSILDKINEIGIEKISKEELDFLNNQSSK